jgi:hypothetical protein
VVQIVRFALWDRQSRPLNQTLCALMSTSQTIRHTQKTAFVIGDQNIGWSTSQDTSDRTSKAVIFNIEIIYDGAGYLLTYSSDDGSLYGDTWHQSESEAEQVAYDCFGVLQDEWRRA